MIFIGERPRAVIGAGGSTGGVEAARGGCTAREVRQGSKDPGTKSEM